MRYSKAHCDNCGTLGIVKNACVGGMDTSQCATCRNADPEDDLDGYECERDYMHGFSKISICAQCFLPCGGELARQFAPSTARCVECVTMVTE